MKSVNRLFRDIFQTKMYSKFGFRDLGESTSAWGGDKWHEMEIIL